MLMTLFVVDHKLYFENLTKHYLQASVSADWKWLLVQFSRDYGRLSDTFEIKSFFDWAILNLYELGSSNSLVAPKTWFWLVFLLLFLRTFIHSLIWIFNLLKRHFLEDLWSLSFVVVQSFLTLYLFRWVVVRFLHIVFLKWLDKAPNLCSYRENPVIRS